jgi:two-component system response regulator GlrR
MDAPDGNGNPYVRGNLVGQSLLFRQAIDRLVQFSSCDAPVLIVGESGTGKELAARALHYLGARCDRAFIPVNCGSLPDGLIESEFYGHTRGAFTDAGHARRGLVQQAEGGTLFLDEVEALTPRAQVSLLRFLQDASYRPVGSERIHQGDVRVIAASNLDLLGQVKLKAFREDLLYRLDVLKLELPPLRARPDDIQMLVPHLLKKAAELTNSKPKTVSAPALEALLGFQWPGNVRQLEHTLLKVHLLCRTEEIGLRDLLANAPDLIAGSWDVEAPGSRSLRAAKRAAVDLVEREYVEGVLSRTGGNISQAARLCGMQRASFSKLVKKHQCRTAL